MLELGNSSTTFQILANCEPYLEREIAVYIIGGANLLVRGVRKSANDHDFVVRNRIDFDNIVDALRKIGFDSVNDRKQSPIDKVLPVADRLSHSKYGIVDIFELIVKKDACYISQRMVKRAYFERIGKIRAGLLHYNDIFLLKAMAARDKDFFDMESIVEMDSFCYETVYDEMERQEHETTHNLSHALLEAVDFIYQAKGIKPRFYRKLFRRAVERQIEERVRQGPIAINTVIQELAGADVTARMISSIINCLCKRKRIGKYEKLGQTMLKSRDAGVLNIPSKKPGLDTELTCKTQIQLIIDKLYLSSAERDAALESLDKLRRKHLHQGRPTRIVSAAAVYFALKVLNRPYWSRAEIARAAGVSNTSLGYYIHAITARIETP